MLDPSEETKGVISNLRQRLNSFFVQPSQSKSKEQSSTPPAEITKPSLKEEELSCSSKVTIRKKDRAAKSS